MSPVGDTARCRGLSRPEAISSVACTDLAVAGDAATSPAAATTPSMVVTRTIPIPPSRGSFRSDLPADRIRPAPRPIERVREYSGTDEHARVAGRPEPRVLPRLGRRADPRGLGDRRAGRRGRLHAGPELPHQGRRRPPLRAQDREPPLAPGGAR